MGRKYVAGNEHNAGICMKINFALREMTHLRYYAPLVISANKQNISSTFYVTNSNKYNCPMIKKNQKQLMAFCAKNNVTVKNISDLGSAKNVVITNEKSCLDYIVNLKNIKKISMTYQTDFHINYKKYDYENVYDHILMPSRNIADFYNLHTDKNLYTGITKYDVQLNKQKVLEKYKLTEGVKKVLFIWPKPRDMHKMPIDIISNFNELGWQVLVKTRGKDPINQNTVRYLLDNGNRVFVDDSWYPHTTQELLEISDLVVNSGSTTIEECVMHEVPLINFDIKPADRHGRVHKPRVSHSYLYDYDFCINLKTLDKSFNTVGLGAMIDKLFTKDLDKSFKTCKKDWLYDHKNSCTNLLNMIQ